MLDAFRPLIVGIGGTPRTGSSSEAALRICLNAAAARGAETALFSGPQLLLPMYVPNEAQRTAESRLLVNALRGCDGIILASPAYHGSVSGLLKNALDYAEDLRADQRAYLDGVPVGLIVCASGWQAAGQTLATLRSIVHALRGWPTPLGVTLNTTDRLFDEAGNCLDSASEMQLQIVGRQVLEFIHVRTQAPAAIRTSAAQV